MRTGRERLQETLEDLVHEISYNETLSEDLELIPGYVDRIMWDVNHGIISKDES